MTAGAGSRGRGRAARERGLLGIVALAPLLLASVAVAGPVSAETTTETTTADRGSRADDPFVDPWWYEEMGLDEVHPQVTGKGVTIAMLDDGLQRDAPALRGADIELMESPCLRRGTDTPRARWQQGERAEHGTAMASLILGGGDGPAGPGSGIRGAAPDVKLLFFDVDDERRGGVGLQCDPVNKGLTYRAAVDAGADIITQSSGGVEDIFGPRAINDIVAENDVVIVASNNDESPFVRRVTQGFTYPAGIPGVVSVNALDRANKPWKYSLSLVGSEKQDKEGWFTPTLAAMGVDLPVPGAWVGAGDDATTTGTSPAAALAAGVMALAKQRHPEATPNQLVQHAIHYTSRFRDGGGREDMEWSLGSGYGLIAAPIMVGNDPSVWPDENPLLAGPDEIPERYPTSLRDAAPTAAPSEASAESGTTAGSGTEGDQGDRQADPVASGEDAEGSGEGVGGWAVLAGVVLVAAVALAVLAGLRRRTTRRPAAAAHHAGDDDRTAGVGRSAGDQTQPGPRNTDTTGA